jgi:hypothetical protein
MLYGAAFGMIVNDRVPAHIVQAVIAMTIHGPWPSFGLGSLPSALPPAPRSSFAGGAACRVPAK